MGQLSLQSFQGDTSGTVYEFADGVVKIGRDISNDIVLANLSSVSRHHAEIRAGEGQWRVVDLKSTNGTFLNRQRITESALRNGDELTFGSEGPRLRVSLAGSADQTAIESEPSSGEPTPVDLFPLHMGLEPVKGKGFLVPGLLTVFAALAISMAANLGNIRVTLVITQLFFAAVSVSLMYRYCGKTKPLWVFIGCGFTTGLVLAGLHSEIIKPITRFILPLIGQPTLLRDGSMAYIVPASLLHRFIEMFFTAALPEELEKIVPAGLGLMLFLRHRSKRKFTVLENDLVVREPLDGILMGVAAAAGFSVLEGVINPVVNMSAELAQMAAAFAKQQSVIPLQLLVQGAQAGVRMFGEVLFRGIGNIAGHQAYSGIFGYYVGLAALYPGRKMQLLLRGFLTATLLHTLWNTLPVLSRGAIVGDLVVLVGQGLLIFAALAILIASILQARKISPTRASNFATVLGAVK